MRRPRTKRTTHAGIALVCVAWALCAIAGADAQGAPESAGPGAVAWTHAMRLRGDWLDAVSVALVDDPHTVIIVNSLGSTTVWDAEEGVQRFLTPPHAGFRPTVVADAAGKRIAIGASTPGGGIAVWDTSTGARLHGFSGATPDMSRDGRVLAAITASNVVTLWALDGGDVIRTVASRRPAAKAVSLDAKGARIAIGWGDKRAEVWDVRTGERLMVAEGHARPITAVDLTLDGSRLATAAGDFRVKVWDVATGGLLATCGAKYNTTPANVLIDSAGSRVVAALRSGRADLWDVETGTRVLRYGRRKSLVGVAALSPDATRLAGALPGRGYSLWTVGTGERAQAPKNKSRFRATAVQLSADGGRALAFAATGGATLHDVTTGKEIRSFGRPSNENPHRPSPDGPLLGVRLIGDGRQYLDAFSGRGLAVRDVATDDVLTAFDTEPQMQQPLILSPDCRLLLTGGAEKHAHLWDVTTGAHMRELAVDGERVQSAAFGANSAIVVTNGQEGPARVWDTATGEIRATVAPMGSWRHAVSVSPDGRYLLLSSGFQPAAGDMPPEPTAYLWDLTTVTPVAALTDATDGVAWGADSQRLYTAGASEDAGRAVRVWSATPFDQLPDMPERGAWARPTIHRDPEPVAGARDRRPKVALTPSVVGGVAPTARMQGITGVAVAADGGTFARVALDGAIDVWRRADAHVEATE